MTADSFGREMSVEEVQARSAAYFTREGTGARCQLCPHNCRLKPGQAGLCRVRECREGGKLVTRSYGSVSSIALDPVEKKPLYHYYPGSTILSLGSFGCNLRCQYCQNWQISQQVLEARAITPQAVAELAQAYGNEGCIGAAFTYNEPAIWYEFVWDAAEHIKAAELSVVLVTNGYMSPKPWRELLTRVDAVNVDIKGWSEEFYRRLCGGRLEPVLDNVEAARELCHVELTYLIVPGCNDDDDSIRGLPAGLVSGWGEARRYTFPGIFPIIAWILRQLPSPPWRKLTAWPRSSWILSTWAMSICLELLIHTVPSAALYLSAAALLTLPAYSLMTAAAQPAGSLCPGFSTRMGCWP